MDEFNKACGVVEHELYLLYLELVHGIVSDRTL